MLGRLLCLEDYFCTSAWFSCPLTSEQEEAAHVLSKALLGLIFNFFMQTICTIPDGNVNLGGVEIPKTLDHRSRPDSPHLWAPPWLELSGLVMCNGWGGIRHPAREEPGHLSAVNQTAGPASLCLRSLLPSPQDGDISSFGIDVIHSPAAFSPKLKQTRRGLGQGANRALGWA